MIWLRLGSVIELTQNFRQLNTIEHFNNQT